MYWPDFLAAAFVFVTGAAIGSFLNVVIYRIPEGISLVSPPSRCPHCLTRLKPYDNVPVLGWLWLRGRCRYCQTPVSWRYPLIEAVTGCLFLLVFWIHGWTWLTLGYCVFFSWLLALAIIDIDTFTLPHPLTKWGLLTGLGFQAALIGLQRLSLPAGIAQLVQALLGVVVGIWIFSLMGWLGSALMKQEAMGQGDGKLAAMMGAWLGWKMVLVASFLACAIGAVVGVTAIGMGRLGRRQPMPFGPSLALGGAVAALYGEQILASYLRLIGWS